MKIWRAKAEKQYQPWNGTGAAAKLRPGTRLHPGTGSGKDEFAYRPETEYCSVYEVQIPGKKRMETGAFLRGYEVEPGTLSRQRVTQRIP